MLVGLDRTGLADGAARRGRGGRGHGRERGRSMPGLAGRQLTSRRECRQGAMLLLLLHRTAAANKNVKLHVRYSSQLALHSTGSRNPGTLGRIACRSGPSVAVAALDGWALHWRHQHQAGRLQGLAAQ